MAAGLDAPLSIADRKYFDHYLGEKCCNLNEILIL